MGKELHLPFEIEHHSYWALKNYNPDLIAAGEKRMFQLHELDELRHQAYENSRLYKARTKVWDSDFLLLEEADAFLALADDPTSSEVNESYYDLEGDILILETLLNSDPSPPPNQGNYLPKIRKELNTVEAKLLANSQLMKSSPPRSNLRTYRLISNMHFWKTTTSCQS
ncbi:hypothetical protein Tco_0053386 [Tanacetum coccineum]